MQGCEYVRESPNRDNILYEVKRLSSIESDLHSIVQSLCLHNIKSPQTIIYCRSRDMVANIYLHFLCMLGAASHYPEGADKLTTNRLFAMYHAGTIPRIKNVVLSSFSETHGVVRVVIATVALGMGVDLRDIRMIVHYGAPTTIEDYFQESGRGGRGGQQAKSVIYWKPADVPHCHKPKLSAKDWEVELMRRYLENNATCRRTWLLRHFDGSLTHSSDPLYCCDICAAAEFGRLVPHMHLSNSP